MAARRYRFGCLFFAMAAFSVILAICTGIWNEAHRVGHSNVNGKAFMMVAYELQAFVEATGRWPENEEEFLDFPRDFPDDAVMKDLARRTIIVYDVDLAEEDLDSVENFRLLKPRDPVRFNEYAYTESIPELLKTLRAARDGALPIADADDAPAGKAPPDESEAATE